MREIKLRAWSKEEQKMVMVAGLANMDYEIDSRFRYITIASKDAGVLSEATPQIQTVELMQYTGLEDNLGTEVYEGDIVAIYPLEKEHHATVEQTGFGWCFKQADGTETTYMSPELFRVVGNIYEAAPSKDLLPKEKKT